MIHKDLPRQTYIATKLYAQRKNIKKTYNFENISLHTLTNFN